MSPVSALVAAAALTWIMVLVGSFAKSGSFGPKAIALGLGNRDNLPEQSAFAGRADRAAKNMLENLLLFVTVMIAAMAAGVSEAQLKVPCAIFVGARVVYAPIYWAGITIVRTALWATGCVAMAWIGLLAMGVRL